MIFANPTDDRPRDRVTPRSTRGRGDIQSSLRVFDPITVASLEKDLGWHEGRHPLESWHFASNLTGGGKTYSFRIHALIVNRGGRAEMSFHFCLMDSHTGWIREVEDTVPLGDVENDNRDFAIRTENLLICMSGAELSIVADLPDAVVELDGLVVAPVLFNDGVGRFDFLGAKQYKFAVPTIHVTGSVSIMGHSQSVSGAMWLNRQWGDLPPRFSLRRDLNQRQWISLYPQLSNGMSLSLTQIWDFNEDRVKTHFTVMLPDGTNKVEKIAPLHLSSHVSSRLMSKRYPRLVIVESDALETYLQINLPYSKHEVVSRLGKLVKFDGEITVSGHIYGEEITGDGFVEMVGRWS